MPRDSQRFVFAGPWRGLDELTADERLAPGWLRACTNMENYKGQLRPRRGTKTVPFGRVDRPSSPIVGLHVVPAPTDALGQQPEDTILAEERSALGGVLRLWRYAPMPHADWVEIGDAFDLTLQNLRRFTYCNNGGWSYVLGGTTAYAYSRFESAHPEAYNSSGACQAGSIVSTAVIADIAPHPTGTESPQRSDLYSYRPHQILITSGNLQGQLRRITAYNPTTFTLDINPNWDAADDGAGGVQVAPAAGDTYIILADYFCTAGLPAPDAPTISATGTAGSIPDGIYDYVVTYYDTIRQIEGPPSEATATTTVSGGDINDITLQWNVPDNWENDNADDLFANSLRIYRRAISPIPDSTWRFVAQVDLDPTGGPTATYNDTTLSLPLTSPPPDHFPPPDNPLCAIEHKGRVYWIVRDSRTVWYSEAPDAETGVRGGEHVGQFSFFVIPQGGPLTGGWSFGDALLLFQTDGITACDTSGIEAGEGLPFLRRIPGAAGCSSLHTIAEAGSVSGGNHRLFYANDYGVHEFDGGASRNLTDKAVPTTWSAVAVGEWRDMSKPTLLDATGLYDPIYDRYLLFHARRDDSAAFRALVWSVDTESWLTWDFESFGAISAAATVQIRNPPYNPIPIVYTPYYGDVGAPAPRILVGLDGGRVSYLSRPSEELFEDGIPPVTTTIGWSMTSPRLDVGDPVAVKRVYEVTPIFSARSDSRFSIETFRDAATTPYPARTFDPATALNITTDKSAPYFVGAWCRQISFRLFGSSTGTTLLPEPLELVGLIINWRPKGLVER